MMIEYEKLIRLVNDYRNDVLKLTRHIEELERKIGEAVGKNNELQGKVATLMGRIRYGP
jgi:hypothetical protein